MFLFLLKKKKWNSHNIKIKNGQRVLIKINTFLHNGAKINYLRKIDPFVFEELVLTAFEKKGYRIKRNKKYTGDGGIDGVIFSSDNSKYFIQCKRYNSYVRKKDILDFNDLVINQNYDGGFFCHTGKTGKDSLVNFSSSKIQIISGNKLIDLISHDSFSEN